MDPSFDIDLTRSEDGFELSNFKKAELVNGMVGLLDRARATPSFRSSKKNYEFRVCANPSLQEMIGGSSATTSYKVVLRCRTLSDRIKSGLRRIFCLGENSRKKARDAARTLGVQLGCRAMGNVVFSNGPKMQAYKLFADLRGVANSRTEYRPKVGSQAKSEDKYVYVALAGKVIRARYCFVDRTSLYHSPDRLRVNRGGSGMSGNAGNKIDENAPQPEGGVEYQTSALVRQSNEECQNSLKKRLSSIVEDPSGEESFISQHDGEI